jgi:hypothetical protein
MAETRRKFDRDFKEGAVRLVRETGRPDRCSDGGLPQTGPVGSRCDQYWWSVLTSTSRPDWRRAPEAAAKPWRCCSTAAPEASLVRSVPRSVAWLRLMQVDSA